jgi:broad specificity phosphatase PhoE
MGLRLTLICHASTSAVRRAAFPADEPIDAQGEANALALAGQLGRVDAAWTSPALRARQTAVALQLAVAVDPRLRDLDLGRWAGRDYADVQDSEPDAVAAWTSQSAGAPHGGESVIALIDRVGKWLDALKRQDRRVVAVTHPAVIRAAIVCGIDAKPLSFWRIDVAPLCRVSLWSNAGNWTLRSMAPWPSAPIAATAGNAVGPAAARN